MIKRLFRGIWGGITVLRLALANLLFIAVLVFLWFSFRGGTPTPLPERAALLLDPAGQVVDQRSRTDALSLIGGADGPESEVLLRDLIDAVEFARKDPRITALVLAPDQLLYIGQSKTLELAEAIARFRDSGKPVIAAGDYFTQDQYRLAVEADHIVMHPMGAVGLEGYSSYMNYFAEALEKLAVTVHVFRAGDHKSLGDPFLRSDMSTEEKAITERWLTLLWQNFTRDIEARRGLPAGRVNELVNHYPRELAARDGDPAALALNAGLVDELLQRDQRDAFIAALVDADDGEGGYISIAYDEYLARGRGRTLRAGSSAVAVVNARGNMLPGEQDPGTIGADSLAALLRDTAARDEVGAIVLRINSGGGSVFAAEVIRAEIARIREAGTPVVVSMGAVAASGGYYIAAEADAIYATEATLTGSIGVFAAFPTVDRLLARGGIYTDGVGTTKLAGALRLDRPLDPLLAATLQQSVDRIHRDFIDIVSRGRELPVEQVRALADGRPIAAADAAAAGLVDEIGGLADAVRAAASLARLDDYEVIDMDPPLTPQQLLLQRLGKLVRVAGGPGLLSAAAPRSLSHWLSPLLASAQIVDSLADPRHLYMRCLGCAGL
jgi:protease-4